MNATRASVAAAVLVLAGCSAAPAPQSGAGASVLAAGAGGRVVALGAGTMPKVTCPGLLERTLGDGRMEVVATLEAAAPGPFRLRVGCVFLDAGGRQVGAAEERSVTVVAGTSESVRFDAASPDARSYLIRAALAR